jgi:hypothetical protein
MLAAAASLPAVLNVVDYQTKDRAGKSESVIAAEVRQN